MFTFNDLPKDFLLSLAGVIIYCLIGLFFSLFYKNFEERRIITFFSALILAAIINFPLTIIQTILYSNNPQYLDSVRWMFDLWEFVSAVIAYLFFRYPNPNPIRFNKKHNDVYLKE